MDKKNNYKLVLIFFCFFFSCQKKQITKEYYDNGVVKVKAEKNINSGKFDGKFLSYDSTGVLEKEAIYNNGIILEEILYYPESKQKVLHVIRHDTLGTSSTRMYEPNYGCVLRKFFMYKGDYLEEQIDYHCPENEISNNTYLIRRGDKNVLFRSRYYDSSKLLKDSSALYIKEKYNTLISRGDTIYVSLKPRYPFEYEYPELKSYINSNRTKYIVEVGNYDRGFYTTEYLKLDTIKVRDDDDYITIKHTIKEDSISYLRGFIHHIAYVDKEKIIKSTLSEEMKQNFLESDSLGKSIPFEFKYHIGDSTWH